MAIDSRWCSLGSSRNAPLPWGCSWLFRVCCNIHPLSNSVVFCVIVHSGSGKNKLGSMLCHSSWLHKLIYTFPLNNNVNKVNWPLFSWFLHHIVLLWQTALIWLSILSQKIAHPDITRHKCNTWSNCKHFYVSPMVFQMGFCYIRNKLHILKLSVPFQEAPTGKLQISQQPWQLLLFFVQLSNAADQSVGLWQSLRKRVCWVSTCQQTISTGLYTA